MNVSIETLVADLQSKIHRGLLGSDNVNLESDLRGTIMMNEIDCDSSKEAKISALREVRRELTGFLTTDLKMIDTKIKKIQDLLP